MRPSTALVKRVDSRVRFLRGQKVILDHDLAELYGVTVKRLNEQIKRNAPRFPSDFRFQLNQSETEILRSQIATSSSAHGGRRYRPYAFTEHGAIMAATVLNSRRAIQMSIFVVRAFVRLRAIMLSQREVVSKLGELERRVENHDEDIRGLVGTIRRLVAPPVANPRRIGFELPARPAKAPGRATTRSGRSLPKAG